MQKMLEKGNIEDFDEHSSSRPTRGKSVKYTNVLNKKPTPRQSN
jgi:hypothetical protein